MKNVNLIFGSRQSLWLLIMVPQDPLRLVLTTNKKSNFLTPRPPPPSGLKILYECA